LASQLIDARGTVEPNVDSKGVESRRAAPSDTGFAAGADG
jgi:hypothetical protein